MKTEHAIDWRKTAEEIEADYSALCMDRDEKAERISALEAHNAVLREALEAVIRGCQSAYVIGDFKALKTIREVADDALASCTCGKEG